MTEQELIKKFEEMKGYSQLGFDPEEFLEMEAYIRGYRQALEDLHIIIENSEKYQALKKEIDEYYDEDNEDDLLDLSDIIEKHF